MSGLRLHLALVVSGMIGGLTMWVAIAAWHAPEAAWLRLYDMLPDGCTPVRTFVAFDRETQQPEHEAVMVICPVRLRP